MNRRSFLKVLGAAIAAPFVRLKGKQEESDPGHWWVTKHGRTFFRNNTVTCAETEWFYSEAEGDDQWEDYEEYEGDEVMTLSDFDDRRPAKVRFVGLGGEYATISQALEASVEEVQNYIVVIADPNQEPLVIRREQET